ncbi:hypothetical protein D3C76_633870 [compost metagenome]
MALQSVHIDQQVPLRIAVVGIDAGNLQIPVAARRGQCHPPADIHVQPARQLLAEHQRLLPRQPLPGIGTGAQQRPVGAVGRVVEDAVELRRSFPQTQFNPPGRQHGIDILSPAQPVAHGQRLLRVARRDVQLGGQALVQPVAEGAAETLGHAADADARRHRQQQGHQRQRKARQLLAAIGDEPLSERPAATRQQNPQQPIQAQRQEQRRAQQQHGQQNEACQQAVPQECDQRQQPQRASQQRLAPQPA